MKQNITIFYKTKDSDSFVIHDESTLFLLPRIGEKLVLDIKKLPFVFEVIDILHATLPEKIAFADVYCIEIANQSEYLGSIGK
jgi:hypothetical protein